jgi:flavodoxin
MKRILIAFFQNGENFVGGAKKSLSSGNTEKVAALIQQEVGGDLFAIEPAIPYSQKYEECVEQAKAEKLANARPALEKTMENMADYEVIFLGFPNWWGSCPMPVLSFLESADLTGKTVIPFCTHDGAGLRESQADITHSAKGAKVLPGEPSNGAYLEQVAPTLKEWLSSLKGELAEYGHRRGAASDSRSCQGLLFRRLQR